MNDDNKPTEEQVKAANEQEKAKWEDDFDQDQLIIPVSREETADDEAKDDAADDDKEEKDDAPVEDEAEYSEPEPVVTVEDPGEYQPKDYSFEIEIKGKTHKVETADDAEKLAEEFAEELTAKQLLTLISKGSKIDLKQERDRDEWESKKEKYDSQLAEQKAREENVANIGAEMEYLVGKGLVPAVPKEYVDADWSDPEVAKQPGVKEQIALLNYMVKENQVRAKAGIKLLTSVVDAYNSWKLDNAEKQKDEEKRQAGEARRAAGARIAGSSPAPQTPYVPQGIAVGNPNVFKRDQAMWDN